MLSFDVIKDDDDDNVCPWIVVLLRFYCGLSICIYHVETKKLILIYFIYLFIFT